MFSRNCRVIKQVDYILLILQRVFYSGSALGAEWGHFGWHPTVQHAYLIRIHFANPLRINLINHLCILMPHLIGNERWVSS
jgi:hypothetical protein